MNINILIISKIFLCPGMIQMKLNNDSIIIIVKQADFIKSANIFKTKTLH